MKNRETEQRCLEANQDTGKVQITNCDDNEIKQKWKWGKINEDNLKNWKTVGAKMLRIVK